MPVNKSRHVVRQGVKQYSWANRNGIKMNEHRKLMKKHEKDEKDQGKNSE